jgi:hypothetical protein
MIETVARTRRALSLTFGRRDALAVVVAAALAYLALYLFAIGHLSVALDRTGFDLAVASDAFARTFESTGTLTYEPIARLRAGPVTWLVSPPNLLLGSVLAGLVGLNLGVSYQLWRRPEACGVNPSVGLLAGIPALLSGTACCGPVILLVVGVQATGALLTAFDWLVPAAALLLVGTLVLAARNVSTTAETS